MKRILIILFSLSILTNSSFAKTQDKVIGLKKYSGNATVEELNECPSFKPIYTIEFKNKDFTGVENIIKTLANEDADILKEIDGKAEYYLDKFDFNSDGLIDIIVLKNGSGMCGSAGCQTNLFIKKPTKQYKRIDLFSSMDGVIKIIDQKKNRFFKLLVPNRHDSMNSKIYRYAIWGWNGSKYDFEGQCKSSVNYYN